MSAKPRVYLAGPGVFYPNAADVRDELLALCARNGLEGVWPGDDRAFDAMALADKARAIFRDNLARIEACAALVADLTPFRGPHCDAGTAGEMLYAHARGKPVFAWTGDWMAAGLGAVPQPTPLAKRMSPPAERIGGALRDHWGQLVEDFGLTDNLMIACAVESVSTTAEQAIARASMHLNAGSAAATTQARWPA